MIPSLLDNDLYKFTMQRAVREAAPGHRARYELINRGARRARPGGPFMSLLRQRVDDLSGLALSPDERDWLAETGWFDDDHLSFLAAYRFDPGEVTLGADDEGELVLTVEGPWETTILWEVPLLALICQTWHETQGSSWRPDLGDLFERSFRKGVRLIEGGCRFSDFGTRRRRGLSAQQAALLALKTAARRPASGHAALFMGTSNLHFARLLGLQPVGTIAHEWIMAHAVIEGVENANAVAFRRWLDVFPEKPAIALSDTFTTDAFLKSFSHDLAARFDGVRQDSGEPEAFIEKLLAHYQDAGIDPTEKTLVFSDGLDADRAVAIREHLGGRARAAFGIGTNLTNDFPDEEHLDVVIKMTGLDGRDSAKLSDDPGKETGPDPAVREARRKIERHLLS